MGMTIDKTIEFFNGLECHTPQAKDARDMAINTMRKYQQIEDIYYHQSGQALENSLRAALEQEPTTKNDLGVDCVARQDVERFIEGFINEYTPEEELEFINLELDGLKHLPPVTPIRPKGYWKTRPLITFCSECGFELKIDNTNYCPNCGAKMDEPRESEDT